MSQRTNAVLVVLTGCTGVGKSTILSSIVGSEVSPPGVLRPTTRVPVVVHHPDDAKAVAGMDLPHTVVTVAQPDWWRDVVLVDSPDLDSVDEHNRDLAWTLAEAADLWIVVTSPARYADAAGWDLLRLAAREQRPLSVVLSRAEPDSSHDIATDLARLLTDEGLGETPVLLVDEQPAGGLLTEQSVAPVRRLLEGIADDPALRVELAAARRTAAT